jgi:hypothetical protein
MSWAGHWGWWDAVAAEEREWVGVREAVALAADPEVESGVVGGLRDGPERVPAVGGLAGVDRDRREGEVGDPPPAAQERHDPPAGTHPAGDSDLAGAGCADGRTGRGGEVSPAVLAGREGVRAEVEAARGRAGNRR